MKRISKAPTRFHEIRNTRYASRRLSLPQLYSELQKDLDGLRDRHLLRALTTVEDIRGAEVRIHGRWLVNWCSNDYLGLSLHPRVIRAAADAAQRWGVGARASRLLAGTTSLHAQLESELAAFFGAESALVFASGYLANLGTLTTLLQPEDTVYLDRLCHASLVDACRASRAKLRVFAHQDAEHLSTLFKRLAHSRRRGRGGRCLVVTEGVFSMDGDRAPLNPLLDVARKHDAILYVDDAHGAFVLGPTGRGSPEAAGVSQGDVVYMGTLGKALGAQGGFVVGSHALIRTLINRARPFIYATALAVPVVAAALEALQMIQQDPAPRLRVLQLAAQLHQRLTSLPLFRGHDMRKSGRTQYRVPGEFSHVVPIIVGSAERASALSASLREQGIWAPAVRPPTVPANTARLRLSLTALHTERHIHQLIDALCARIPGTRYGK